MQFTAKQKDEKSKFTALKWPKIQIYRLKMTKKTQFTAQKKVQKFQFTA